MVQEIPSTVCAINKLPPEEKRAIYLRLIPDEILAHFNLPADLRDAQGNDLVKINCESGCSDAEMSVYHQVGFRDPILYGHITDSLTSQLHILLYVINDPASQRFDIDRMPDGTPTLLGASLRNLAAEEKALAAGIAPGQIRQGLRLLYPAASKFEQFVHWLGHDLYFVEPLYYHNAYLFERYGFAYARGKNLMERIAKGFSPDGDLCDLLDNSTPFRKPEAANSIRLRSWAIHDGILGEPFNGVSMYKMVGKQANINTDRDCRW